MRVVLGAGRAKIPHLQMLLQGRLLVVAIVVVLKVSEQAGWRGHAVLGSIQRVFFLGPHDLRGHVLRV